MPPNLQTGKAKPIGVASAERMEVFPNVASFRERGIAVEWDTGYGMVAPANRPPELVAKISTDMLSVMNDEEVRASMNNGHCAAPGWPAPAGRPPTD